VVGKNVVGKVGFCHELEWNSRNCAKKVDCGLTIF